jgi:RHS repeat-associated protein
MQTDSIYDCTPHFARPRVLTPSRYTGKERDAESGLDYFGARYYASNVGRWMSPDWAEKPEAVPYSDLSNPQSLNLYAYVNNNPTRSFDPDGHGLFDSICNISGGPSCEAEVDGSWTWRTQKAQQQNSGEGSDSNVDKRNALASAATDVRGSDKWAKGSTGWKCNIFVCNMLAKVGMSFGGKAPNAGQWASSDPNAVPNWRVLGPKETPLEGDVASYSHPTSDATGHVGIVTSSNGMNPYITAAGQFHIYTQDANTFSGQGAYTLVYRRYVGN